jgi:hypothetical protein
MQPVDRREDVQVLAEAFRRGKAFDRQANPVPIDPHNSPNQFSLKIWGFSQVLSDEV